MWSAAVNGALTVLFVVTGGCSLARWAALRSGAAGPGDPVAELSHLVMSLAMIGMAWGYGGTAGDILQIVVFSVFGMYFATRIRAADRHCRAPGFHLLMCVAMVWMVLTMPLLMPMSGGGSGAPMDGMDMGGSAPGALLTGPAPGWIGPATGVLAVTLLGVAGLWLRSTVSRPVPAVAGPAAVTGVRLFAPRVDAACHLLMCLGMAATLLLML